MCQLWSAITFLLDELLVAEEYRYGHTGRPHREKPKASQRCTGTCEGSGCMDCGWTYLCHTPWEWT